LNNSVIVLDQPDGWHAMGADQSSACSIAISDEQEKVAAPPVLPREETVEITGVASSPVGDGAAALQPAAQGIREADVKFSFLEAEAEGPDGVKTESPSRSRPTLADDRIALLMKLQEASNQDLLERLSSMQQSVEITQQQLHENVQMELAHQGQILAFFNKVLAVLLGEVLSSTGYELITVLFVGNGTMSNWQALQARSVYAVFITLYMPVAGYVFSKIHSRMPRDSLTGIFLESQTNICPVLLAWGWKDWAAALDTWAGAEAWDEIVVAASFTLLVVAVQSFGRVQKHQAEIAAGGNHLFGRFLLIPASFGLACGYLWNEVATFGVSKIQALKPSWLGTYSFEFVIQAGYTIFICATITRLTIFLKRPTKDSHSEARAMKVIKSALHDWSASGLRALMCIILSFIYAWAVLDASEDWVFGVMFQCSSYSSCSYQSNFAYAVGVTLVFSGAAVILNKAEHLMAANHDFTQAVELLENAMILTVGWAWMNFYSTFMSSASAAATSESKVAIYFISAFTLFPFHTLLHFIIQRVHNKLVQKAKIALTSLEKSKL